MMCVWFVCVVCVFGVVVSCGMYLCLFFVCVRCVCAGSVCVVCLSVCCVCFVVCVCAVFVFL